MEAAWVGPGSRAGNGAAPDFFSGGIVLALLALVAGSFSIWNWYAHQPKPPSIGWSVRLDNAPDPDDEFQPQNLTLSFDSSVAKIGTDWQRRHVRWLLSRRR